MIKFCNLNSGAIWQFINVDIFTQNKTLLWYSKEQTKNRIFTVSAKNFRKYFKDFKEKMFR